MLLIFCYTHHSCKRFLDIEIPKNELTTGAVFVDDVAASAAVSGAYSNMASYQHLLNANITLYGGMLSDELLQFNARENILEFIHNQVLSDNSPSSTLWDQGYKQIYICNAILEGIESSSGMSAVVKKQYNAEMLFIRSLCHFYLVNLFGDIPWAGTTNYEVNNTAKREPVSIIYNNIINDLKEAKSQLNVTYYTSGKFRPNKSTVSALLARVYLYNRNWELAEEEANEVIANKTYSLESDLNKVFQHASTETIWHYSPFPQRLNTLEGNLIAGNDRTSPSYYFNEDFYNAFELGDQRKYKWVRIIPHLGVDYKIPFKYKLGNRGTGTPEYYVLFRLGEQFLIRAEARTWQNNFDGASSDLDSIRLRAGLRSVKEKFPVLNQELLLKELEHERRFELAAEWAHRWFDLKRTNRALAVLSPANPRFTKEDMLLPIPASERIANYLLTQNEGYE